MATSPDLTPYVDLRPFDRDVQDVYETAVQNLKTRIPEWNSTREDSIENMLLEAMALEVAESIMAINRLPGAIVVALMKMYGVERSEGNAAKTSVKFRAVDSFGYTVPGGTRFAVDVEDEDDPLIFVTDNPVVIPNGSMEAEITATAVTFTDAANEIPAGTIVTVIDSITFLETATLASPVVGGSGPESDEQWFSRGVQRLRRLVDTLVVPEHFRAAALENSLVQKVKVLDLYNPSGNPVTPAPGNVTLVVYGPSRVLTAAEREALRSGLQERSIASLGVHVIDPTIVPVNVTTSVKPFAGYSTTEVQNAVSAAIASYLSPLNWDWSKQVRVNELIALVSNVPMVDYVETLTMTGGSAAATALPVAGTLNVTVI